MESLFVGCCFFSWYTWLVSVRLKYLSWWFGRTEPKLWLMEDLNVNYMAVKTWMEKKCSFVFTLATVSKVRVTLWSWPCLLGPGCVHNQDKHVICGRKLGLDFFVLSALWQKRIFEVCYDSSNSGDCHPSEWNIKITAQSVYGKYK